MEESYIKKSTLIRDFRKQIVGKPKSVVQMLDEPFFDTINRVFRKKPHDVKFHISKENTMTFNIEFKENVSVYLEHFPDLTPSTLVTISQPVNSITESDDDGGESIRSTELDECLDLIDEIV